MAQTALLMCTSYSVNLRTDCLLLHLKTQRLGPKFSHLLFYPLPSFSSSSSPCSFTTPLALFKLKTKAPPKVSKPKPKVEDGIFGTSGGFGFTKQSGSCRHAWFCCPLFGFTKANEPFIGRLAQLGFVFSVIGEIIPGKGALTQLNNETGVPVNEIEPLILFSIVFFFVAALNPGIGKFVTDEDEEEY